MATEAEQGWTDLVLAARFGVDCRAGQDVEDDLGV